MSRPLHPAAVLFPGEKPFPTLPAVDHYAGSEKLMRKALALQAELGPVFDITFDCEDGAQSGAEREHADLCAALICSTDNRHGRVGLRIHDISHPHWRQDLEIVIQAAGDRVAFFTLPKARGLEDAGVQAQAVRDIAARAGLQRQIPLHILIETHGALREVWQIARLPGVESLDLGLMDFVSGHHGAIPASAMKSPGQFDHPLIARAKCEIAAAALGNGVVPTHNVTTELKDMSLVRDDARRARESFGFLRMWSIHPNQIHPILEAMRPDFSHVELAAEILLTAQQASWGPIRHAGRLHDRASYRYFWELLQRARVTGVAMPEAATEAFFTLHCP
jgi:citrate lyase subunit beta/citryl-CoA lyase